MLERFRHQALVWWSGVISRWPVTILLIALVAAAASIALTVSRWHFESNRNALISEDIDWNQRFLRWSRDFENRSYLIIAIDVQRSTGRVSASRREELAQRQRAMADELGALLQSDPYVADVVWRFEGARISPRTIRLLPMDQFRRRVEQLVEAQPIFDSPTPAALVAGIVGQMTAARAADDASPGAGDHIAHGLAQLDGIITAVADTLESPDAQRNAFDRVGLDGNDTSSHYQYMASEQGGLLFMRVTPRLDSQALSASADAITAIRSRIRQVLEHYPDLEAGLTGIEAIENDETAAMTRDSTIASMLALVLIATLLMVSFHSVRTPVLAVTALLFGITWTFGFLYLTIGHLQVLSVFFTAMLLGLGIAYAIHLATRFELVRHQYPDTVEGFAEALDDSFETTGPGVVTGAVTTAAAFATTLFTDFRGVAEMGAIASVGIVLCLLAMFSVFPALLRLFKPLHRHVKPMELRRLHVFEERWVTPFTRRPRLTLAVAGVLTVASLAAINQMRFDYNLATLLPTGVESVEWQERIIEAGTSIYAGMSVVDDMDDARRLTRLFRQRPTVGEIGGIGVLFPEDETPKLDILRQARQELGPSVDALLDDDPPAVPVEGPDLETQLNIMRSLAGQFASGAPAHLRPAIDSLVASANRAATLLGSMDETQKQQRLDALQADFNAWRQRLARSFDLEPLSPDDLPAAFMRPYVSRTGRYAIEIQPDTTLGGTQPVGSPLDPSFLQQFVFDLESVDPEVTGAIVQYYKSGKLIRDSYMMAGLIALAIVFTLVWIDFRTIDDAVLVMVPVAVGFAVTFGIMYLLGLSINAANITVLPLMFGIGVDAGVHILHRYRMEPNARPLGLTHGTGKGITITSLTTMIGFGSMMVARHRGIWSLGFVLTLGIGLTLLACWTVMPAWLELRARRRSHTTPVR